MVYRAALIGCGMIGSQFADDPLKAGVYSHAEAYEACPETRLVAVCDIDPGRLERCGNRWNVVPRYADARRMLVEQQPDIVSVCTPDQTHYAVIRAALSFDSVRAILAEKPLTLELEEAREIIDLAKEKGVVLAVNYVRRYSDSHMKLKRLLSSGSVGGIQGVSGCYTKGTIHNGTHWFDLARFLIGNVTRVWGIDVRKEGGSDPTLDAYLEFDCGASGYLHGCDHKAFSLFEMDLIGTLGRVRVVESGHTIEVYKVVDSPHYSGYRSLAHCERIDGGLGDVLLRAVADVVHCLDHGHDPRCSGTDGLATLQIAFAVRESAQSGNPVVMSGN